MANKIRNEDLRLNIIVNGDAGRAEIIKLEESMADAKNSIQALKDKQKELADQGKKTSKEYSELTKEFDSKTLAYKKQVAEYNSYLRLQNLEKLSLKELKSLHRATKVAFDNSSRGTDQYNKSLIELQKITAQMDKFKKAVSSEVTELRLLESTLADSEVTLKAYREAQSEMSAQGKESSSEYEAITKSIDEQSIALDKNRARYEELVAEHGTVQLSLKELKNRQKETSNAMEAAVPDSEEFIELRTELNSLTAQIDKVNSSVAESEEIAQRNLDSVNKEIETYDQFESTLADAEKEVRSLKKEQSELIRAGKQNTPEYAKLTKEIDRQSDSLSEQRAKYKDLLRQQDLTKLSLKELKYLYRDTKRIFDDSTPGTAAYKKLRSELDALNQQMKVVDVTSVEMGKTMKRSFNSAAAGGSVLKRTFNTINTKVGGMMAAGASLFAMTSMLERANEQFRELDEAQVDTMKTTGLTTTGVDDLSDSLAQIDTRTPQNELLAIGRIAGKLGVQGKKDILEFTEAADMITVALGDDLGGDIEEVITQVGKLNDIFGLNEQYGYGESMLKVASTLNELGMASTAAEGYLVDFAGRVAGTAPNVDISIQSILGLGATLDKFGITSEVAGTTYGQVIAGMYKKTETFAGIAKMGIGEFKTLMDEDMNEAFIRVMENMGGGDMELIVKSLKDMGLDGQRAQEVLGVLAKNTGELRRQQEIANVAFADGTSILNEFNIKNESATARYEKHQKAMTALSIELGKTLNPAMESSRSVMRGSMEVLIALVKWFYKYKAVILGVGAAIVGYKTTLLVARGAEILYTKAKVLKIAALRAYVIVAKATAAATATQTTATKAATIATKLFSLAIKMTPLGWIALILGAVAGGFVAYALSSTKAARAQRILNDVNTKASEIEDEHGRSLVGKAEEMRLLMEAIENTTTSENSRNNAIKRLQELMPDGINMINEETIASGKAAEAVKGHTEQLILQAQIKAALKLREEAFDKYAQDTITGEDGDLGFWQTLGSKTISLGIPIIEMVIAGQMSANNRKDAKQALEDDIAGYNKIIADAQAELKAQGIDVDSDGDPTDDPDSKPTTTTDTDWSLSTDEEYLKSRQKLKQQYLDGEIQTEEEYNDQLLALEIKSLQDRLAITDKGSEEQIKVQGELTDKLIDQKKRDAKRKEQAEIKERKDNSDLLNDAEATIKAQQQQFEAEKEVKSKQHKEDLLFFKGTDKERRELRQQQMQEQKDLEQKHLEEVATQLEGIIGEGLFDDIKIDTSLLSEEEIKELEQKLERVRTLLGEAAKPPEAEDDPKYSFEDKKIDILGLSQDDWSVFIMNVKEGKLGFEDMCFAAQAMLEAYSMYDQFATNAENKQLQKFKKTNDLKKRDLDQRLDSGLISQDAYNAQVEQMDAEYTAKEDEIRIKQAKRDKAMAISSAIINTAIGVTSAYGIPIVGIALATLIGVMGAAQIALIASTPIETAGAEQGGLVAERMQDGRRFNAKSDPKKRGFVNEPTILVSEKGQEYVIPADGMNNPTLSPFIGAIEQARKSGSLSNFNFEAVYRQPTIVPGYAKGGSVGGSTLRPATTTPAGGVWQLDPSTNEMLVKILDKLDRLDKNSQNPIPAVVSILGKGGLEQAMKRYEKVKKGGNLG